jgi:hypothetical protein
MPAARFDFFYPAKRRRYSNGAVPVQTGSLPRIEQSEFPRRALPRELPKVPMTHTSVHELREADDIAPHMHDLLNEITQIYGPDRRQASISDQSQYQ